jgi:hypothetical protein
VSEGVVVVAGAVGLGIDAGVVFVDWSDDVE